MVYKNMSHYLGWTYPVKHRHGPFPLVQRDQYGHRWIYDARAGTFQNLDLGTVIKVAGPLVVKYLVPFFKELVGGLKQQPQAYWWWQPPVATTVITPVTTVVTERWLCDSPHCGV
jgi:hypothetical protein